MTKTEFEKKIKKMNLQKVRQEDGLEKIFEKLKEIYIDKATNDIYGCFFDTERKNYIIFFLDSERGIARDLGDFKTEDEAYEHLFFQIAKITKTS